MFDHTRLVDLKVLAGARKVEISFWKKKKKKKKKDINTNKRNGSDILDLEVNYV